MAKKSKRSAKTGPAKSKQAVVRELGLADNETVVPREFRKKEVSFFEINVIKRVQKGVEYFSGEMNLAQLASLTHVDNYDGDQADVEGKGQRALCELRGRKFGEFISDNDNVCFAELLLNDRDGESAEFTSIKDMGINIPQHHKLAAMQGFIRIPSNAKLYVYDGQTRRFGYLSLLHFDLDMLGDNAYEGYKGMNVPFCLAQVSACDETKLFLQHNQQKAVPNDHNAMLIRLLLRVKMRLIVIEQNLLLRV